MALTLVGCGSSNSSDSASSTSVSPTMAGAPEAAYCSTATSYPDSVTITGKAQYVRREIFVTGTTGGLGSADPADATHPASVNPIRYAEVRVTNASGAVVQCAETQADGTFSFTLPRGSAGYSVAVTSRSGPAPALNSTTHIFASVLDSPATNSFYSLQATLSSATANADVGTLTAQANGDVLGGAFNIYDQILNANLFLSAQVSNCSSQFQLCSNYDPGLHKVSVYWQKGFNPNSFFGNASSGLSFYLPGYSRLFILGGINGDTDHSDTDHFDNSVIIHEYGHFLEDNWLKSDSPGGAHDGDELLDPRLAWSEGWGDFIQAAVRSDSHYIDTIGNSDGQTELEFYIDAETATQGSDLPRSAGEGNFRELAVTRVLWDALDDTPAESANNATDDVAGRFAEIWAVLTKTQYGFRDPNFAYRNIGLFASAQNYLHAHPLGSDSAAADWTNIHTLNQMEAGQSHFAQLLIPSVDGQGNAQACASSPAVHPANAYVSSSALYFSITPATIAGDWGGLATSDLFLNNRFFRLHIDPTQTGSHTLQLNYVDDDGVAQTADLDLYLYGGEARFGVFSDMLGYSRNYPTGTHPEQVSQTETLTQNLSAGDYLININVYTSIAVGSTADFNLTLDGVILCPATLVPL